MKRSLRGLSAALAVGVTWSIVTCLPADAQGALSSTCDADLVTEQGECAERIPEPTVSESQEEQRFAKERMTVEIAKALGEKTLFSSGNTGQVSPATLPDAPGGSVPTAYKLPEVANMTIFKEGEGNGKKSYTCGPAATRNMVAAMYKHRDGVYKDFGEAQFATWEGTTTAGTARANIASALNTHFSAFGHWTTSRPASKTAYLSTVIADTHQYHQSVIANIDTEELGFWNGKALDHFDFVYGYDASGSTNYLWIAEEWDPIYIYGSSSYGNPYGFHKSVLSKAYSAIIKTSIHGIVA